MSEEQDEREAEIHAERLMDAFREWSKGKFVMDLRKISKPDKEYLAKRVQEYDRRKELAEEALKKNDRTMASVHRNKMAAIKDEFIRHYLGNKISPSPTIKIVVK